MKKRVDATNLSCYTDLERYQEESKEDIKNDRCIKRKRRVGDQSGRRAGGRKVSATVSRARVHAV